MASWRDKKKKKKGRPADGSVAHFERAADTVIEELRKDPAAVEDGFDRGLLCAFTFTLGLLDNPDLTPPGSLRMMLSSLVVQLSRKAEH